MTEVEIPLEPRHKLTYDELVEVLCKLAVRQQQIEEFLEVLEEVLEEIIQQGQFQTTEVLKTRMELMIHTTKDIPFKRFISKKTDELDGSLKGFISYYHENLSKEKESKKQTSKYS